MLNTLKDYLTILSLSPFHPEQMKMFTSCSEIIQYAFRLLIFYQPRIIINCTIRSHFQCEAFELQRAICQNVQWLFYQSKWKKRMPTGFGQTHTTRMDNWIIAFCKSHLRLLARIRYTYIVPYARTSDSFIDRGFHEEQMTE